MLCLSGCDQKQVPDGLVYCSEGNPESFNPQVVTSGTTIDATSHQIYNRLVDDDPISNTFLPALATNWQVSEDGLRYEFSLRQDVAFHTTPFFKPTRNMNADDVVFSFDRIVNNENPFHKTALRGFPYFESIGFSKLIKAITKVDDYSVRFELNYPDASFLSNLATDFAVILSQQYAEQLQQQGKPKLLDIQAVGTGPYRLVEYVKNEYIRYLRNPHYWGQKPKIEQLVFDITPRSTVRLSKLIVGDCSISALPKAGELPVARTHDALEVDSRPGMNVAYWALNTKKPPFDDIRVRQALAHAIDKRSLLNAVYHDTAVMASGILPPASWAYPNDIDEISYDPEKAKQLLASAGVKQLKLDIWAMPVARSYNPNPQKTAELLQADLSAIGVKVNIISYDWSVFTQRLGSSDYDSVIIGWSADNSDPDNFFTPLLSCGSIASHNNWAQWCDRSFDDLITHAKQLTDTTARKALYVEAEKMISQQVPLIPLAYAQRMVLKRKDAPVVTLMPFGGISFGDAQQINSTGGQH
ncbi:ABC transporter substrate-binding protein SapA [Shewanella avicenniae]|uniref:ABC transporter substrate-binding protein SapA n=1 Tax=Shewanella avicenniae TaxID=2814294 RepID=UPI001E542D44|nr:ABC transporter substrate-binding protein SapA [Shewanella avicenniae]